MTREHPRLPWPVLAPLVALLAVTSGVVALGRTGSLLVHHCVPGDGVDGWLGLRLALLRADSACPTESLAVGGDGRHVLGVAVVVALPVLLGHLAGVGLGLGALGALRALGRAALGAVALLGGLLGRLPGAVVPLVRRVARTVPASGSTRGGAVAAGVPWRRGPPGRLGLGLA